MDEKQFMKKVLAILEKQQAALKKMAQAAPGTEWTDNPNDPNYWDPLNPRIRGDQPKPQLDRADPWAQKETPAQPAQAQAVDAFKAKLDANPALAKLKGNLLLTGDPKNLSATYYTGAWKGTAQQLKDLLKSVLGANVVDAVGHMKLDFTPNY